MLAAAVAVALAACASAGHDPDAGAVADAPVADAPDEADAPIDALIDAGGDAGLDACVSTAELCNSLNDDCDSGIDEDFPTLGDSCSDGVGACLASGMLVCSIDGDGVECNAIAGTPVAETCNATDDDCDTMLDEGFGVGGACDGADGDLCNEGAVMCDGVGGAVCSDVTGTNTELCNSADEDCDGAMDEGLGLGTMCDGTDTDLCLEGVVVCNGTGGTRCNDSTANNVELCNSADDDCDGTMDEGLGLGMGCDGGDGDVCAEGVLVCGAGGAVVCSDTTPTNAETCNGMDEDCDATSDEGFPVGAGCSVGVGACLSNGQRICSTDGTTTVCNAVAGTPSAEFCGDGIDQDCNGSADPGCPGNDLPGGAIDISAGGTFTVDLTYAHDDDANTTLGCGQTGGRDVFYQFTLGATEVVYADTFGSSYDSVIRIYSGTCPLRTGTPSCSDDSCAGLQSQRAVQLAAGTYCLVIDQYSSTSTLGATTLTFVRGGRPGTALATGTGLSVSGTTGTASNLSTATCQTNSNAPDQGYYYLACPATSPTLTATTCTTGSNFDTVLYQHRSTGAGAIGSIACNDDTATCATGSPNPQYRSSIGPTSAAGPGLFWMIVDGYGAGTGSYQITYTLN